MCLKVATTRNGDGTGIINTDNIESGSNNGIQLTAISGAAKWNASIQILNLLPSLLLLHIYN